MLIFFLSFFFCPCHFCSLKYSAPSNAYHLILLSRASSNTASLVKSSLLPSTGINTSLFCVARAICMLFGSFGVHLFTNCILNVSDDHQALSDTGKKRQAFKKFILRNVNLLAQMHVIHAENKHSNGVLNQSLGRLSGRGNLTVWVLTGKWGISQGKSAHSRKEKPQVEWQRVPHSLQIATNLKECYLKLWSTTSLADCARDKVRDWE